MSQQIIIPGLSPTGKVPGGFAALLYGQGGVSPGQIPRTFLVVGTKLSSGSLVPDSGSVEITPSTDIHALVNDRSELAQMIREAQRIPGLLIRAAAVAEAGGAASATLTITFANNATSPGTWSFYLAGERVEANIALNDTPTQQAAKVVAAFTAKGQLPCTAANVAGVVTLTIASAGARGNMWTLYKDESAKPGGTTCVLASASAYAVRTGNNGETGVRFGGGTGTDDVTNLLAALSNRTHFTIAIPHTDATNIGRWKTWNATQAAIGSQRYQEIVAGSNELEAVADSIASSTLNDPSFQLFWVRGSEDHPGVLAAGMAAIRQQKEQIHPNQRFDGDEIPGLHPQRSDLDRPSGTDSGEQALRLDSGVSPGTTTDDGKIVVIRAITTFCRKNGNPFYGCIDCGQSRGLKVGAEVALLTWLTEYSPANPYVNDDPAPSEADRPPKVATPSLWKSYLFGKLAALIQENWFSNVEITAVYDPNNKQINTDIALTVTPQNHRVGMLLRQTS